MKGCRNCAQWQALEEFLDRIDPATQDTKAQLGLCRRYAPRPLMPEAGAGEAGAVANAVADGKGPLWNAFWPRVASDDWCGEWDPQFD